MSSARRQRCRVVTDLAGQSGVFRVEAEERAATAEGFSAGAFERLAFYTAATSAAAAAVAAAAAAAAAAVYCYDGGGGWRGSGLVQADHGVET